MISGQKGTYCDPIAGIVHIILGKRGCVMRQGRWVSYIYRYRDNVRCENVGFIKVQRIMQGTEDNVRIQIGLRLYKKKPCVCVVYLLYDGYRTKKLSELHFAAEERDTIMSHIEVLWNNPLGDGMTIEDYDGLFLCCNDVELLTGMWHEYAVNPEQITDAINNKEKPDHMRDEDTVRDEPDITYEEGIMSDEPDNIRSEAAATQTTEMWQTILDTYPKLPLFADSQFLECVKISPQDIGKLAIGNWRLGINTFVSHGYYHYRYLMLGRVSFEEGECVVIGVPGVFTNKEKYLANMFGFDTFIPAKPANVLTGSFGYWVSELRRE